MATKKKLLQAAAGQAGGAGLNVEDVFSTYLYEGTGADQTITNGIDLENEGGLVWIKSRNLNNGSHYLSDTERGIVSNSGRSLSTNNTNAVNTTTNFGVSAFNSDGFSLHDGWNGVNGTQDHASWTFRKAPKFFDVVTYTGNGATHRDVPHNLESAPGWVITKRINDTDNWMVYSKASVNEYKLHWLNTTDATHVNYNPSNSNYNWTDSVFYASSQYSFANTNANGVEYVSYLFANNDDDGEFGPDGDADIIKCGSFPWGSSSGTEVNLGFEPQWIIFKAADQSGKNWFIFDAMRGIVTGGLSGDGDAALFPNTSGTENVNTWGVDLTPTGFIAYGNNIASSGNIIYMAIRRGTKVPESATEVFDIDANGGTSSGNAGALTSGFPVDLVIYTQTTGGNKDIVSRINSTRLQTNLTNAENTSSRIAQLDFMDGYGNGTFASDYVGWMWKRAPGFFDAVAYSGNSTAGRTVSHNLGVAPEMMWVKRRDTASGTGWFAYHKDLTSAAYYLNVNSTAAESQYWNAWNSTAPTSSVFSLGNYSDVNLSGGNYIAYLFASLPGISKVGSFTGNGTSQDIDCGFTSGARFVLLKRTDSSGTWFILDTERGIVAGNDAILRPNTTTAEDNSYDIIDPLSSGFTINYVSAYNMNASGATYIFYAIA